jgi:hypothetical protein
MSAAADFVLVTTDPATGKSLVSSMNADAVHGGAVLLDLVAAGHLALEGRGRHAKVVVADPRPSPDPVLEESLARVRDRRPAKPGSVVTRLGKKVRARVCASLEKQGVLRERRDTVLGLFPVTRHDVVDVARRDELVSRVRACLLLDQDPDERVGAVIGLLSAADLVKVVVDKPDRKRAKARAKVVAEGDWASEAVRQAIAAAQTAMTMAAVGAAVASSGS